jgi:hypothetical protein
MSQPSMPRNVGSIAPPSLVTYLYRNPYWDREVAQLEQAALAIDTTLKGKELAEATLRLSMLTPASPPKDRPRTGGMTRNVWSSFAPYAGRGSKTEEGGEKEGTSKMTFESVRDNPPTSVDQTQSASLSLSRTETKA